MSQSEIIKFLNTHYNKEFSTEEIADKMGISDGSAYSNLYHLFNSGFIRQRKTQKVCQNNKKSHQLKWSI